MRRFVTNHQDGSFSLIQRPDGVKAFVVGAPETVELNITDEEWQRLRNQLQTDQIDFATVKKEYGITEEAPQ